jgi:hypothetical protein
MGIVNRDCVSSRTSESANSDQYAARLKVAVAARPGAMRGRATRRRVSPRDAPSRRAASSTDGGSASKNVFKTMIVNGTCTAA